MASLNVHSPARCVKRLTHGHRKHLRLAALAGGDPFRDAFDDDTLAIDNAASSEAEGYFRNRKSHLSGDDSLFSAIFRWANENS